jgi:hypothetical protein
MPIIRRGIRTDLPNDVTFAEELLATMRAILKSNGSCPECSMGGVAYGSPHGLSLIHAGDDCHLGQLMTIAEEAGI